MFMKSNQPAQSNMAMMVLEKLRNMLRTNCSVVIKIEQKEGINDWGSSSQGSGSIVPQDGY